MPILRLGPVTLNLIDHHTLEGGLAVFLDRQSPLQIVTFNALMFTHALKEPALAAIVSETALSVCDSVGIAWAAKFLSGHPVQRLPGIDLLHRICRVSASTGKRIYLLGARPGVAQAASERLKQLYPGLIIAGTHHGYFHRGEEAAVVDAIRGSGADILFVAMAIPFQEEWIARRLSDLRVSVAMGVGGSFDVLSGNLKRAPRWMQRMGIEWSFRFMQQPSRLLRIGRLAFFVVTVLNLKLRGWRASSK